MAPLHYPGVSLQSCPLFLPHSFFLSLSHTPSAFLFFPLCFSIFRLARDPLCSLSDNPALQEVAESECTLLPGEISFLSGQQGDSGSQPKETAEQRNSGGDHIRPWAHAVEIKSSTPSFGRTVSLKGVNISSALKPLFSLEITLMLLMTCSRSYWLKPHPWWWI